MLESARGCAGVVGGAACRPKLRLWLLSLVGSVSLSLLESLVVEEAVLATAEVVAAPAPKRLALKNPPKVFLNMLLRVLSS